MVKIIVDGKIVAILDDLRPEDKEKKKTIEIGPRSTTTFKDLKVDRIDFSKWANVFDQRPAEIEFYTDGYGRTWALKNAWVSSISYSSENDNIVKIDEVNFAVEDLIVKEKKE